MSQYHKFASGMQFSLVAYLLPFSIALVLTIAVVVSFRRQSEDGVSRRFLALMYWAYAYALGVTFLIESGMLHIFPHMFRTAQIATLVYGPLSYLYVRHTLKPGRSDWTDVFHIIPLVVYLVDYTPFFLLSGTEKMAVFKQISESHSIPRFGEGWLMPRWGHVAMRYLVLLGYWLAQARLVYGIRWVDRDTLPPGQRVIRSWLRWLTGSQLLIMLPPLGNLLFSWFDILIVNAVSGLLAALPQAYFLLFRPEILYGYHGKSVVQVTDKAERTGKLRVLKEGEQETGSTGIAGEKSPQRPPWMLALAVQMDQHMEGQKPFLRQGYGLPDLAREMGCTTNQLSYLINKHYGMNFNSMINHYRVLACREKLGNMEFKGKTLEALAQECGFHNRTTFINAFKYETGLTPSAYIKTLGAKSV